VVAIIQLLGRPDVHREHGPRDRLRGRKAWSLLAMLALSERPLPRHTLIRMLFPQAGNAAAALRWVLSELRRGLRPHAEVGGEARDFSLAAADRSTAASAWRELAFVATGARRGAGALLRQARELADGDDGKLAATLGVEAIALVDNGRFDVAARRFRHSIELAERAGEPRKAALSLTNLARAELAAGRAAEARTSTERARVLVAEQRWTAFLPFVLAVAAELDLREGRAASAGEQLACAWTTAVELADPCWLAITGRGLGLLAAQQGDVAGAMRWLDSAYHRTDNLPRRCAGGSTRRPSTRSATWPRPTACPGPRRPSPSWRRWPTTPGCRGTWRGRVPTGPA
jgi:tetratricopeptide (TPR) repeat protein